MFVCVRRKEQVDRSVECAGERGKLVLAAGPPTVGGHHGTTAVRAVSGLGGALERRVVAVELSLSLSHN